MSNAPARYKNLTGDYYWDSERVGVIRLGVSLIITAVFPPVGAFLLGWYITKGVTTEVGDE